MQVHRIKLRPIDHTFSSEEAINNLGSLKFSQSNRMPDPKDQGRIVTTTTTTTFSMAREMARSVCQKFIDARFIESADGKLHAQFTLKGGVWQVTPKGLNILGRFCQRNGIGQSHISTILSSDRNTMQLVLLERDPATDRLSYDRGTVEVIFRRFIGVDGPNIKTNTLVADSESVHEYSSGLVGVKLAAERRLADGIHRNTFTGRAAVDWLMDCCTTVDRRETLEIAASLVHHGLIYCLSDDKTFHPQSPMEREFQPSRLAVYGLTDRGKRVAGWTTSPREHLAGTSPKPIQPSVDRRDAIKLTQIITDPALRLQFKEFLRDIHCEENLLFFLDVKEFTDEFKGMTAAGKVPRVDVVRETLAQAYGLYNAFLAPGSPCELNIDSKLRNGLAGRMTRAVGDDHGMLQSLKQVAALFEEAQDHVFKLMATVSPDTSYQFRRNRGNHLANGRSRRIRYLSS